MHSASTKSVGDSRRRRRRIGIGIGRRDRDDQIRLAVVNREMERITDRVTTARCDGVNDRF